MTGLLSRLFSTAHKELPETVGRHRASAKAIDRRKAIEETEFVAFDTELTGPDFAKDTIISIGAVRLHGGSINAGESFYRLVRPETELNRKSVVVHELTHTELADAEDPKLVLTDFLEYIEGAVLIGHFVNVDVNFMNRALKDHFGIGLASPAVDTVALHDWLCDNHKGFRTHFGGTTTRSDLYSMARQYGIEVKKSHNSFIDAYLTAQLFQRFVYFLKGAGVRRTDELLSVGKH